MYYIHTDLPRPEARKRRELKSSQLRSGAFSVVLPGKERQRGYRLKRGMRIERNEWKRKILARFFALGFKLQKDAYTELSFA